MKLSMKERGAVTKALAQQYQRGASEAPPQEPGRDNGSALKRREIFYARMALIMTNGILGIDADNPAPFQGAIHYVCFPGAALRLPQATRCCAFGAEEARFLYRWIRHFGCVSWTSLRCPGMPRRLPMNYRHAVPLSPRAPVPGARIMGSVPRFEIRRRISANT